MSEKVKGLDQAIKNVRALGSVGIIAMGQLLANFGRTRIEAPAKREYVPVVTGNLRSTIMTGPPEFSGTRVRVVVSAGGPAAPYALKVHENPRAGKTGGYGPYGASDSTGRARRAKYKRFSKVGQWKYLETPAMIAAKDSKKWLEKESAAIMKEFKRLEVR